jgi:tRNA A37 threonylcarbamoyladenosine synthetase subunit TsaC/SUA5/YrdC
LILPGDLQPLSDPDEIRQRLEKDVDVIIDAGPCGAQATTIVDLTGGAPQLIRAGKGSLALVGLEAPD